nr:hypothetical protein BaRGS_022860 [Batillaria attramentaria]
MVICAIGKIKPLGDLRVSKGTVGNTEVTIVEKEVKTMLELGVIEPSKSNYCSPVVLVSKKDGSVRFCIDFRALNKVTLFDAEPIPDTEELFCRLNGAHYFTKIDLAKGHIVSEGILKPEPGKVQKILDIAKPVSKRQRILATFPVLLIPDLSKEFIVRTDASKTGLGAVLLQDKDGNFKNCRITRWALALQEFRFRIEPVQGKLNVFADCLSRSGSDQLVV